MKVGDLVRMSARSLEPRYGVGLVVRDLRQQGERLQVQVFWSRSGLGNRCNIHSLEKISGNQEG